MKVKAGFFRQRKTLAWRIPIVVDAIRSIYPIVDSVIDLGCGNGDLLRGLQDKGYEVTGVEYKECCLPYLMVDRKHVFIRDLSKPLQDSWNDAFGLVMCLEVAEHIWERDTHNLIQTIKACTKSGGTLIFSAAPPGCLGVHHVNLQFKEYWVEKLKPEFAYNKQKTEIFKTKLETYKRIKGVKAYYEHGMVFSKLGGIKND